MYLCLKKRYILIVICLVAVAFSFSLCYLYSYIARIDYFKGIGIVYKRSSNYVLVFSIRGNYYIKIKENNYQTLDIIYIEGKVSSLTFSHYEGSFNFKEYLFKEKVFYEIESNNIQNKFLLPLRLKAYQDWVLNFVETNLQNFISRILFNRAYDSNTNSLDQIDDFSAFTNASAINIIFLIYIFDRFCQRRKINKRVVNYVDFSFLIFLFLVTGLRISILRLIFVIALKRSKFDISSLDSNSIFFILLTLFNPLILLQESFYYPIILVVIINFSGHFLKSFNQYLRPLSLNVVISSAIAFISIYNEDTFSFLTIVLSFPLLLISRLVILLTYILYIVPPFAYLLNFLFNFYLKILISIEGINQTIYLSNGKIVSVTLFVLLGSIIILRTYKMNRQIGLVFSLIPLVIFGAYIPRLLPKYEIHFIDVGQGDATLIRNGNENILIDTGGSSYFDLAKECLVPYFKKIGISKLDYVLITHRDFDHYGALTSLEKMIKVDRVLYDKEISEISLTNLKIENLNKNANYSEINDNSAVLRFTFKNLVYLLMGDASINVEKNLMDNYKDLDCDILKVGHHGSKTSSSKDFISRITPKEAIISCGENNIYKHPNDKVISNLVNANVKIRRTDKEGTIVFK